MEKNQHATWVSPHATTCYIHDFRKKWQNGQRSLSEKKIFFAHVMSFYVLHPFTKKNQHATWETKNLQHATWFCIYMSFLEIFLIYIQNHVACCKFFVYHVAC